MTVPGQAVGVAVATKPVDFRNGDEGFLTGVTTHLRSMRGRVGIFLTGR